MNRLASDATTDPNGKLLIRVCATAAFAVLAITAASRADDYATIAGAVASPLLTDDQDVGKAYTDGQVMLRVELARQRLQLMPAGRSDISGPLQKLLGHLEICHRSMQEIRRLNSKVPDIEEIAKRAINASPALVRTDPDTGKLKPEDRKAVGDLAGTLIVEGVNALADAWNISTERDNYRTRYRLASVCPKNCFAATFSNFFAEKILEDETFLSSVAY